MNNRTKNNKTKFLKRRYIPVRLFAESQLPEVKITTAKEYEDVSLVFSASGYLPGKPTYRAGKGLFIPLRSSPGEDPAVTNITEYYKGEHYRGALILPEEYESLLKEIRRGNDPRGETRGLIVERVEPEAFLCYADERSNSVGLKWIFFRLAKINKDISEVKIDSQQMTSYPFYIYMDESDAFPRHFVNEPEGQGTGKSKVCSLPGDVELRYEGFKVNSVYRGVYAVDISASLKGWLKLSRKGQDFRLLPETKCIFPENIKQIPTEKHYFIKIFVINTYPAIIGYKIENTYMLKIDLKDLRKFVKKIVNNYRSQDKEIGIRRVYKFLSINTAYVNSLKHVLAHDLIISYYLSKLGFTRIQDYVDLIFLFHDLYNSSDYTLSKKDPEEYMGDILNYFKRFDPCKKEDLRLSLIRYLISPTKGVKQIKLRHCPEHEENNDYSNKINERVKKIIKVNERLFDIVTHTYGHHLMRMIGKRYSVSPEKFLEKYFEGTTEIGIIENDAGGLGILENLLEDSDERDIEDFVLTFGTCLVGTPEDLLHFALCEYGYRLESEDITNVLRDVIRKLEIVVTPEEFEEAKKRWHSIVDEANKFVKLLSSSSSSPIKLLGEIHKFRCELENHIGRFPEFNELIIYILKKISDYNILYHILKNILYRFLEADEIRKKAVARLYGFETFTEKHVEQLLMDIKESLRGSTDNKVAECLKNKEREDCKNVLYVVKLVGRVLRGLLMRLALLSCNSACGLCYVNTDSCGRYSASFVQAKTLDRRMAKIVVSEIVKNGPEVRDFCEGSGVVVELGDRKYRVSCEEGTA